ncbi:MAG: helix-turn-helix domain-containing protein [Candidatus Midichloria sp.]|nr:helix-turn-helix domain-containing protein [Candidatus Midichloria sp.]
MIVQLLGSSKILLESFNKNKVILFLEEITFLAQEDNSFYEAADLWLTDDRNVNNWANLITLGIDIELPCSIYDLVSLIKKKLFLSRSYRIHDMVFKPTSFSIFEVNGKLVLKFTEKESAIIEYLIKRGHATELDLLNNIWNYSEEVKTSTVETHIYRLKNKLSSIGLKNLISFSNKNYVINL